MFNFRSFNFFCIVIIFSTSSFCGVVDSSKAFSKACSKSKLLELHLKHLKCVEDLKEEKLENLADDDKKEEENNLSLQDTICSSHEVIIEKCTKQIYRLVMDRLTDFGFGNLDNWEIMG